jgi:pyridoxine/pyridoxamine 5'-phosphate oxidase
VSFVPTFLTREDFHSTTWEHFCDEMSARLAQLRYENDSFSDHETTVKRRGRIAELKEWLDLAKQAQSSEDSARAALTSVQSYGTPYPQTKP